MAAITPVTMAKRRAFILRKPAARKVVSLRPGMNLEMTSAKTPRLRNHASLFSSLRESPTPRPRNRSARGRPPWRAIRKRRTSPDQSPPKQERKHGASGRAPEAAAMAAPSTAASSESQVRKKIPASCQADGSIQRVPAIRWRCLIVEGATPNPSGTSLCAERSRMAISA